VFPSPIVLISKIWTYQFGFLGFWVFGIRFLSFEFLGFWGFEFLGFWVFWGLEFLGFGVFGFFGFLPSALGFSNFRLYHRTAFPLSVSEFAF
jgi:hypothetical protein